MNSAAPDLEPLYLGDEHIFDLQFSPVAPVFATAQIDGSVKM